MTAGLLTLMVFTVAFALVGRRLARSVITAPMAFLALGLGLSLLGPFRDVMAEAWLHRVAEVALVLLLFLDAAQTDLRALARRHVWPVRMLALGLPLTVALGALVAYPLLPELPLVAVVLVAAILAPTDAALGQAVVTNPLVPERARRALTVESGLNDGLALPVVLLFASLSAEVMSAADTNWLLFGGRQLLLGPLAGAVVGLVGGKAVAFANARELTSDTFEGIAALGLAGTAFLSAGLVGGNGFIAAFVAGLCFGHVLQGKCRFIYEFTEGEGLLLTWGAFFLVGVGPLPEALSHLTVPLVVLILTSLFVVRPVAIWLSLVGTDASPRTRLFFGWFGPRGLATALFALLVVEQISPEVAEPVLSIAINAVWISALLHGVTAVPGGRWYAHRMSGRGSVAEDSDDPVHGQA